MRTKKKEKKELKMEMLKYVSGGSDKEITELKAVILANPDLESAWKTAVECFDDTVSIPFWKTCLMKRVPTSIPGIRQIPMSPIILFPHS